MRLALAALLVLAPSCACRQRCCPTQPYTGPVIPLDVPANAPAPSKPDLTLTILVAGRYEDQPGFLHIGWPDGPLTGYNLQDDSRAQNFRTIAQRLEALQKSKPGASARLILDTNPEWQPRPSELVELKEHLRAAGYLQVDVTHESLEGKPLSRP